MKMTTFLGEYFFEKGKAVGYKNDHFFLGVFFMKKKRL